MSHVSFTELRQRMARLFDQVAEDREPLVVTRQRGKSNLVVMSEEEFEGWRETVHLLSSPKNAARLMASIRQLRAGGAREHELVPAAPAKPRSIAAVVRGRRSRASEPA
jgi:antitoxin YefM